MQREHVIFFRNPSTQHDEQDPYESAMTSDRYTAYTQPVLQQEFVNEDRLADVLGDSDGWAAVVATSKRAGEAWANAIRSRKAAKSGTGKCTLRSLIRDPCLQLAGI